MRELDRSRAGVSGERVLGDSGTTVIVGKHSFVPGTMTARDVRPGWQSRRPPRRGALLSSPFCSRGNRGSEMLRSVPGP